MENYRQLQVSLEQMGGAMMKGLDVIHIQVVKMGGTPAAASSPAAVPPPPSLPSPSIDLLPNSRLSQLHCHFATATATATASCGCVSRCDPDHALLPGQGGARCVHPLLPRAQEDPVLSEVGPHKVAHKAHGSGETPQPPTLLSIFSWPYR